MHIGVPKTGTSALQVYFAQNRDVLLKQSLDYLPTGQFDLGVTGHITSGNAAQLARSLAPKGSPLAMPQGELHIQNVFDAIRRSPAEMGLISSETLSSIPDLSLKDFADRVEASGVAVKIILYVRTQIQLLVSGYIQHVKRAACTELPDDFVRRTYKADRRLKYHTYVRTLQTLFGEDNVICRVYEDARESPGGLSADFLRAIGKAAAAPEGPAMEEINNSLPAADLAIMLLLNHYSPNIAFCDMVIENARIAGSAKTGMIHQLLSPALTREISGYFAAENRALAQLLFDRDNLFDEAAEVESSSFISPDELSARDVASFMSGIVVRFHARLANLERRLPKGPLK